MSADFHAKEQYQKILAAHVERLSALQELHYASAKYAILLIFQGMDGAGKDGAIRHVMSGLNPEGCEVFCFKQPSEEELKHDFLRFSIVRIFRYIRSTRNTFGAIATAPSSS